MDLSERKRAILAAVIRAHVKTGEPVGSRALCAMLDTPLSSATLRNEMSDLCELGYLCQPHTSAGRVPTAKGYRLFVDGLMKHDTLSADMRLIIDSMLCNLAGETSDVAAAAGQILSDLTGLPVITFSVADRNDSIRKVELVPAGKRTALMIIITAGGQIKNRMCRLPEQLTSETIERFSRLCEEKILGKPLGDLTASYSQELVASLFDISIMTLVANLFAEAEKISRSQYSLKGESNIFRYYSEQSEIQRIMEILSQHDTVIKLLNSRDRVEVLFGEETGIGGLKHATIVSAGYGKDGHELGRIGIIGPTRMAYESLIPSVEYFADSMSRLICETLTDLEAE